MKSQSLPVAFLYLYGNARLLLIPTAAETLYLEADQIVPLNDETNNDECRVRCYYFYDEIVMRLSFIL